ncbi:hypothetical protein VPH35_089196 [Triticum aestivum]
MHYRYCKSTSVMLWHAAKQPHFAAVIWSILCISVPGDLQCLSANATRRAAHPRLVMWASVLSFDIFGSHCRFNSVRCQAKDVTHRCCEDLADLWTNNHNGSIVWCSTNNSHYNDQ